MKQLSRQDQPLEKMKLKGVKSLSDEELIAVLLHSGTAGRRVTEIASDVVSACQEYGGLSYLGSVPYSRLTQIQGIGPTKAMQIQCLGELGIRYQERSSLPDRVSIHSPKEIAAYMSSRISDSLSEELWGIYLDVRNQILLCKVLFRGTADRSIVSVREIFREGIQRGATKIVLFHNHPSGDPTPSRSDIEVTETVAKAGTLMETELMDHIILGNGTYVSLKELGYL